MAIVKLENVSFNKLKEFTSLGNKRNTTIKGKFTLIGEYELITKDGGDGSMTLKELTKVTLDFIKRQEIINNQFDISLKELTKVTLDFIKRQEIINNQFDISLKELTKVTLDFIKRQEIINNQFDKSLKELTKITLDFIKRQEIINNQLTNSIKELTQLVKDGFAQINQRIDRIEARIDNLVIKNNLKE